MPAETTISVKDATKERFTENYVADGHYSQDDALNHLMDIVPTLTQHAEGCAYCGNTPPTAIPAEAPGGVVLWYNAELEGHAWRGTDYFCSTECAEAQQAEMRKYAPEAPDLVVVGGHEQMRTSFRDASYYIDHDAHEVGIPVPGAFTGTSDQGDEYEYVGEPVYIKHEGDWIRSGTIESIVHEEVHTGLILTADAATEGLNHPDDERREQYERHHAIWYDHRCPECGADLRVHEKMTDEVVCGECGETFERQPVPGAND